VVSISPQQNYTEDERPVRIERRLTAYVDNLENGKTLLNLQRFKPQTFQPVA
jgi:hypothetical protein